MAWISEKPLTFFETMCMNIIKIGQIPNHVAFIMDGNRRFASKYQLDDIKSGHVAGFLRLSDVLQWSYELGILEISIYAFSIENFKRSACEVRDLMILACDNFQKLLNEKEKLMKSELCVRIVGDLELLEPKLQQMVQEIMALTKNNRKMYLNVAFAYTARNEITTAVKHVVHQYQNCEMDVNSIDTSSFTNRMFVKNPVDILFRTSNEARLSDFLLWQIPHAIICFDEVLWPEYSIWHLLKTIFRYQRQSRLLTNIQNHRHSSTNSVHF